jgi:hypothetical protein
MDRRMTDGGGDQAARLRGGRSWWAHLDFTRMNVDRIILENQLEDLMKVPESR